MPNKTVYISPENEANWEKFKDRYSSVNNFLSSSFSGPQMPPTMKLGILKAPTMEQVAQSKLADDRTNFKTPETVDLQKAAVEQNCCTKSKPCQHWDYSPLSLVWVNSISGRTRSDA